MVMELIRAASPLKGRFFLGFYRFSLTHVIGAPASAAFFAAS
jgi:hypothetical protein